MIFGGETVEDNPWMDMSLFHVLKSVKNGRRRLTFRCTLELLDLLRHMGEGGGEEVEDTNKTMQY